MKFEDFKIVKFGEKTIAGNVYSIDQLKFDCNREYVGYVNYEASVVGLKDAAAFVVEKLRVQEGYLVGDLHIANGKATELLIWISDFNVGITSYGSVDDDGNVIDAEIISFVAYPTAQLGLTTPKQ